jgi:hypothetical protein
MPTNQQPCEMKSLIRSLDLEAEVEVKSRKRLAFSRRFPVKTRPGERLHEDQV